jgi:hypothetical protein
MGNVGLNALSVVHLGGLGSVQRNWSGDMLGVIETFASGLFKHSLRD